jgi:hypothetical protein
MSYLHILNLYKAEGQAILLFKECYAMEKVHGTSAHISFNPATTELTFFSGGEKHDRFISLFNQEELKNKFIAMGLPPDRKITIYGEAAGGKQQGMSHTYGTNLFFIVFDVLIGENCWQDIPNAEQIATNLGLEFVPYHKVNTDLTSLDAERDRESEVAIRKGMGRGKKREGVVLRPSIEVKLNNGERVICKHKQDWSMETSTPRKVEIDPDKIKVLADAQAVANEWCTFNRLQHVLDKIDNPNIEKMGEIIKAMTEDVLREGAGEIVESDAVKKSIGRKTALLYKEYLNSQLRQNNS